jgi:hypothetical protein
MKLFPYCLPRAVARSESTSQRQNRLFGARSARRICVADDDASYSWRLSAQRARNFVVYLCQERPESDLSGSTYWCFHGNIPPKFLGGCEKP